MNQLKFGAETPMQPVAERGENITGAKQLNTYHKL